MPRKSGKIGHAAIVGAVPMTASNPAPKPATLQEALAQKGETFLRFGEFGQNWETPGLPLSEAEHDRVARCMRGMWLDVLQPQGIRDGVLSVDKHMADLIVVRGPEGKPQFGLFWPKIVLEG